MSTHNPVDIGNLCVSCYAKGIKTDTTKEGFVNRVPSETSEYSGYQCGPCVQEDSDYIDKMHAEEDLGTILEDALNRAKENKLLDLGLELEQVLHICDTYGYEALLQKFYKSSNEEQVQDQHLLTEESWRAGYDVLTEGALGDYPEE